MATINRRCRNKITRIKGQNDEWLEEEGTIGDFFAAHYASLFTSVGERNLDQALESVDEVITGEENNMLMADISFEEVKQAVFQMGGQKAPGPDGFTGLFSQKSWDIVGNQEKLFRSIGKVTAGVTKEIGRTWIKMSKKGESGMESARREANLAADWNAKATLRGYLPE